MRYMDALAIFEMAVELFAVYFCVSYLFRMHKDKPLYVVVLLGVVFLSFLFSPGSLTSISRMASSGETGKNSHDGSDDRRHGRHTMGSD